MLSTKYSMRLRFEGEQREHVMVFRIGHEARWIERYDIHNFGPPQQARDMQQRAELSRRPPSQSLEPE